MKGSGLFANGKNNGFVRQKEAITGRFAAVKFEPGATFLGMLSAEN